jgi:hypothetical protein
VLHFVQPPRADVGREQHALGEVLTVDDAEQLLPAADDAGLEEILVAHEDRQPALSVIITTVVIVTTITVVITITSTVTAAVHHG